ncbi:Transketolase central region [Chloroherpeton thalassium ATCC 35110]|uniref:1-deoxy-D-xylulose-5-phosphate synthase n=1 Tax=Chloroherpeton thalassium (strain ATCC 35110 / GB-78) TaxID=517418 RepID=B3QVE2_CHLT3|nr:transketolase C-terminal domain-containing protein [Chloroherpeton thalassium]ACF14542.1 Transketolase central region [Chloroherpeton thalassium ATCC 35110]
MTYQDLLLQISKENDKLLVMTAENRAAIRGLPQEIGDKFVDVGIAEQTMIGAAAGLALRGRVPLVHALATFLTLRAFEFIRTDVGIANLPVKVIGGVPGFLSDGNGPTHQAIEDISLMRGIPNMKVFCPADEEELVQGMKLIIDDPAPWYVRYNAMKPCVEHKAPVELGKAEVLSEGYDVALLVYGFLLKEAQVAKELLEKEGLSVRLVNVRTLKPIDGEVILKAARETRLLVTVEDHFLTGGLFSILSELLVHEQTKVNVLPIALKEKWFKPALLPNVLQHEGFTGAQLATTIMNYVKDAQHSVL